MATVSSLAAKRQRSNLEPIITHLRRNLAPLHPVPTGPPHPEFPATILSYHLLTEDQLDRIARYYHQDPISPTLWMYSYPACMNWDREFLGYIGEIYGGEARVNAKRRKVGKFIGLRGCDTPVEEVEEKERWAQRRARTGLKMNSIGYSGRRGFGQW